MKNIKKIILVAILVVVMAIVAFGVLQAAMFSGGKIYIRDFSHKLPKPGEAICAAMTPECGVCGYNGEKVVGIIRNGACYVPIK